MGVKILFPESSRGDMFTGKGAKVFVDDFEIKEVTEASISPIRVDDILQVMLTLPLSEINYYDDSLQRAEAIKAALEVFKK